MTYQTVKQFELEVGYQTDGELHKQVTMKAPTAGDIIALQKDIRFKEAAGSDFNLESENAISSIGALGGLLTLASILVPRIVTQLGSLTQINGGDIEKMAIPDVIKLVTEGMALMNAGGEKSGDKPTAPLASES